jgi:hypothetical protein
VLLPVSRQANLHCGAPIDEVPAAFPSCVPINFPYAGELRAGAWSFTAEAPQSVLGLLGLPPDQLWQSLADSPALARAR